MVLVAGITPYIMAQRGCDERHLHHAWIATLGQWDTTGKIIIGTVANNESRVEIFGGRISIFNRQRS